MALCNVKYICQSCGQESHGDGMVCESCKGKVRGVGGFSIIGTRDNFGIKNAFRDDETGKEIDNWRTWEKAGYRKPLEVTKNEKVKDGIKTKIDKIKRGY